MPFLKAERSDATRVSAAMKAVTNSEQLARMNWVFTASDG
ncbi:hypothetical protein USDA257_c21270 [Sinorhizobium fredii USDA 257]|uniref:Uncharacterized protein n=1 Tax=Sinorhizobium fredii (strain USDA 257) TaxID=1185652 RepID=I3X4A3_SINF2|nr:hypothetical protein USDA257_c21270 [Sinorhizobium fredii USDA 257]